MIFFLVSFFLAAKVDLDNELVRHFLIETTKKGVRLKGVNDEPVFGKFSHLDKRNSRAVFATNRPVTCDCMKLKSVIVREHPAREK